MAQSAKTKLQKFEYREVRRSQVKLAAYNPRSISSIARKRLKKKIEDVGCVEPLVWNEKTGSLVSGHQRISILDEAEGYPPNDYTIGVAVVRLTAKKERALNIFLNNVGAQGQFEAEPFMALLKSGAVELEDIGFSRVDLEEEFGQIPDIESIFSKEIKSAEEAAKKIRDIKDRKKKVRGETRADPSEDADYYLLVAWNSREEKAEWLVARKLPGNLKVISIEEFLAVEEPPKCQTRRSPAQSRKQKATESATVAAG